MTERIYRIRRYSGRIGKPHYYDHADVIAPHWATALKAAKEGRVTNWRLVDKFDRSDTDYEEYEFLYAVTRRWAETPREPWARKR